MLKLILPNAGRSGVRHLIGLVRADDILAVAKGVPGDCTYFCVQERNPRSSTCILPSNPTFRARSARQ